MRYHDLKDNMTLGMSLDVSPDGSVVARSVRTLIMESDSSYRANLNAHHVRKRRSIAERCEYEVYEACWSALPDLYGRGCGHNVCSIRAGLRPHKALTRPAQGNRLSCLSG
ncbi:hypothetical protein MRX96_026522 [Rhipicephalus microplus]